jgi:hypothetical protein
MMKKVIDLKKKASKEPGDKSLLSWEIEEKVGRGKKLQIGLIILYIFCFVLFLWQKNFLGSLLVLVMAFLTFFSPGQKKTYFAILKRGARRGREIFPWYNLKNFWVFEEPPEIYFKSKKAHFPYHVIFPLPSNYIEKARKIISGFIPEKEAEKDLFDVLKEKFGL